MIYDKNFNLIRLSPRSKDNIVVKGKVFYSLSNLKDNADLVFGGNGIVYKATSSDNNLDYVIKICRFPYESGYKNKNIQRRIDRFEREIEALSIAQSEGLDGVIEIICDGTEEISGCNFRYFIMEKCQGDLGDYLEEQRGQISNSQKLSLFHTILIGIKQLNDYKIYHRDIKFDNILFLEGNPKIGDLGLVYNRKSDFDIYEKGEKIGPFGWLSPEATNKFLVENTSNQHNHDCFIDSKSDVFQLGKLGWFIFNENLPLGQLVSDDFVVKDTVLFKVFFDALQYKKNRRLSIDSFIKRVEALFPTYNL